jgi:hypothetical protein
MLDRQWFLGGFAPPRKMTPEQLSFLALAIFIVAFLYSCVGHAGASGYIAVMSLFSLAAHSRQADCARP